MEALAEAPVKSSNKTERTKIAVHDLNVPP